MRLWIAALLLLPAQDPKTEFETRFAKERSNLAVVRAGHGDWLAGKGQHLWAKREYELAIELNPDLETARSKLGFRRVDGGWEFDPAKKVKSANEKSGAEADKIQKEYLKRLAGTGTDFARRFGEIADFAEKNGLREEAAATWRRVLEFDSAHRKARETLGYQKLPSGGWATAAEVELKAELRGGVAKAPKGAADGSTPEYERAMAIPMKKHSTPAFVAASPHLDAAALERLVQHAGHVHAAWHRIFNVPDAFGGRQQHLIYFQDHDQHVKYIDLFHKGTAAQKEYARKLNAQIAIPVSECVQGRRSTESLEDFTVHAVAQNLTRIYAIGKKTNTHDPIWLQEGISFWFTYAVNGTAEWGCVELGNTQTERLREARKPETWAKGIHALVSEGEDPPVRAVVNCTNGPDMDAIETVKAWSLVDFLILEHREKFSAFCRDLRAQDDNGEKSFQKVFGWTLDDLNAKWRSWVLVAYAGR